MSWGLRNRSPASHDIIHTLSEQKLNSLLQGQICCGWQHRRRKLTLKQGRKLLLFKNTNWFLLKSFIHKEMKNLFKIMFSKMKTPFISVLVLWYCQPSPTICTSYSFATFIIEVFLKNVQNLLIFNTEFWKTNLSWWYIKAICKIFSIVLVQMFSLFAMYTYHFLVT